MIAMSVEAMRKIGFEDFKVDLGQVDFYRGIMASADLELDTAAEIQSAIARKDLSSVTSILETINISDSSKSEIFALSRLFGGIELLDKAYITVRNDRSRRALDNLAKVINILSMYGVSKELTVDLGEIRGLAYHTGLTFEGFVPGLGEPICGGGRYDSLMGKYGESRPATGFAFNMLNLLQVFDNTSSRDIAQAHSFLIFSTKEDKKSALSLASALRRQGFPVARDIIRRDFAQSIEYARFNGIEYTLVIGDPDLAEDEVLLVNVCTAVQKKIKACDLYTDAAKLL
jgi:ATP phosphoribosyltransferase regulatory subunit